jgi:hypothetical protein
VSWTFVYLMLGLKLPIVALLWIVWWAVHQEPEPTEDTRDDGGTKTPPLHPHPRKPHPRKPFPRVPRRGPHAGAPPPSPARVRAVVARARRSDPA